MYSGWFWRRKKKDKILCYCKYLWCTVLEWIGNQGDPSFFRIYILNICLSIAPWLQLTVLSWFSLWFYRVISVSNNGHSNGEKCKGRSWQSCIFAFLIFSGCSSCQWKQKKQICSKVGAGEVCSWGKGYLQTDTCPWKDYSSSYTK